MTVDIVDAAIVASIAAVAAIMLYLKIRRGKDCCRRK